MKTEEIKILIACEESQAVCIEFRRLGFQAFSCDILPCSGGYPKWHIQRDVMDVLRHDIISPFRCEWDCVIAFPPCTDLAVSGAKWFEQKRKDGRQQKSIMFFEFFTHLKNMFVAIENPIGIMSKHYRKPDQIIQPYMFGDPVKKSTCLWLKGLPKLVPANNVENDVKYYISEKGAKMSEWYAKQIIVDGKKCGYNTPEFKKHRSTTFHGIAKAMAEQWGEYILKNL